jgi:hypothetical protein
VGGRKIGLERVKDQEKRREQENHNVRRGLIWDRKGLIFQLIAYPLSPRHVLPLFITTA